MLAGLTGVLTDREDHSVVVDVHGVAFRVLVTSAVAAKATIGATISLVTYLHVREDALDLYGFQNAGERRLFERLLTVSGVGPKLALSLLGAMQPSDLEAAIDRGDAAVLQKVSGVGKKTAERIIVDLRGKMSSLNMADDTALSQLIDALTHLGYSVREAREAAQSTSSELTIEERIKAALRQLGK